MQQWGYHPDIDCHYGFLQWHDLSQRSLQELHMYDGIHSTRGKYYHARHGTRGGEWGVGTLSRLKVAMSVVRQEVELLTPPPSLSPRHYNHNWFPLKSEPESQCNTVGKQLPTIPWAALYYYYYYSGSDQVHTATQILQHHVHRRPGGRGVLQHRGGAASQEVGHQPGPRLPCEVSLPDWGETPAEWFQRQVRSDSLTSLRLLPNSIIRFKLPSIQLEKIQPEMRSG